MSPRLRTRRSLWRLAGAAVGAWVVVGVTGRRPASAKSSFDSPYTLAQTYNAALRLVRVDLGLVVTERDAAAAYLLFDYRSTETGSRAVPGSIEMLDSGRSVKVVVQLGQMPRYHEQVLGDALARKLRDEYGDPAARKPKPDATDAGAEGAPPD
jgi:hypothetical protein